MRLNQSVAPLRQASSSFLARPRIAITAHQRLPKPHHQRRAFLPLSLNDIQTLSATRTLPYPASAIYSIIADIPSYSKFLPYCLSSRVTKTSGPDARSGKRWPAEAVMVVGWGDVKETFHSKIYCVPERIVEAVGGKSETTLSREEIAHHGDISADTASAPPDGVDPSSTRILTHLLTRWTLRPFPYKPPPIDASSPQDSKVSLPSREQTEVSLNIEFQFANPAYGLMSRAVAPRVADTMVSAFEKRIAEIMDGSGVTGERRQS